MIEAPITIATASIGSVVGVLNMIILGHLPLCVTYGGKIVDINIRAIAVHMLGQVI
jgi:hypothetical protein